MNSQGPGQIHVRDVNGFPGELTYVHLQVGIREGSGHVLSWRDRGLTRMCIPIFLASLWRDLAEGQE